MYLLRADMAYSKLVSKAPRLVDRLFSAAMMYVWSVPVGDGWKEENKRLGEEEEIFVVYLSYIHIWECVRVLACFQGSS